MITVKHGVESYGEMKVCIKNNTGCKIFVLTLLIVFHTICSSAEIYEFERMWPTLQQPWYFFAPRETAIDSKGYIYVADASNYRVVKLSSNGQFIKDWSLDNHQPYAITIDGSDYVYVVVNHSDYVAKFTSNGDFIAHIGNFFGTGDGEFFRPAGIAIDNEDNLYVVEKGNQRVQKFNSDGEFLLKWGQRPWGRD